MDHKNLAFLDRIIDSSLCSLDMDWRLCLANGIMPFSQGTSDILDVMFCMVERQRIRNGGNRTEGLWEKHADTAEEREFLRRMGLCEDLLEAWNDPSVQPRAERGTYAGANAMAADVLGRFKGTAGG